MFTRILVDFDPAHLSHSSLLGLLDLAAANHSALTFLALRPKLDELLCASEDEFVEGVRRQIADEWGVIMSLARQRALDPRLEVLAGDPIEVLLGYGRAIDADLIVAGKSHSGGIRNAVLGLPWKALLTRADVAVLILP
ncbi:MULTISPECIES: universal stress protein [Achromobacter]|uniref:Universal stress protein n=1 Tax=Achromobacter denitrificans TaxID=32002 RepID=A0ABZ3G2D1_ACHDE|nr:universal stress protein [Achromobacter xylosoxidans]QCS62716.1 universal stress protein [Achromobacter denitrificans]